MVDLEEHVAVTLYLNTLGQLRDELRAFLGLGPARPVPIVETLSVSPEDGYVLHSTRLVTEDEPINLGDINGSPGNLWELLPVDSPTIPRLSDPLAPFTLPCSIWPNT
jgi:hypothetical protein